MSITSLSPTRIPLIITVTLMLANLFAGNLQLPSPDSSEFELRSFAAAIAFPTIIGYLSFVVISVSRHFESTIVQFTHSNPDFVPVSKINIDTITRQSLIISGVSGTAAAFGYMLSEQIFLVNTSIEQIVLNLMAIPFWIACLFTLIQISRLTNLIVSDYLTQYTIDLFGIRKVSLFSDFVVNNIVLVSIAYMLVPLLWIGRSIPSTDILVISITLFCLTIFLFRPVFKVQRLIGETKTLAITRINYKISEAMEQNVCGGRRITDNPRLLRHIASLISTKSEISKVSEWPVNLPQSLKALAITASAPLSMVAGSLVDYALEHYQLFGF